MDRLQADAMFVLFSLDRILHFIFPTAQELEYGDISWIKPLHMISFEILEPHPSLLRVVFKFAGSHILFLWAQHSGLIGSTLQGFVVLIEQWNALSNSVVVLH